MEGCPRKVLLQAGHDQVGIIPRVQCTLTRPPVPSPAGTRRNSSNLPSNTSPWWPPSCCWPRWSRSSRDSVRGQAAVLMTGCPGVPEAGPAPGSSGGLQVLPSPWPVMARYAGLAWTPSLARSVCWWGWPGYRRPWVT